MPANLDTLQQHLNHQFSNLDLAHRALTHRSANKLNNERLEFLGDSLLGFIVAEVLYEMFPDAEEGQLSRTRAALVNKETLAEVAREIQLGEYLQLGLGELKSGGKQRDSILADALEAIIAAIYLDAGMPPCKQFVRQWSEQRILQEQDGQKHKDCKTRLQELLQARGLPLPVYEVEEISGEAHEQSFRVSCTVSLLAKPKVGDGRSKRIAEQQAAEYILAELGETE